MYLSSESLLIILIVGVVAGWLAGQIVQGTGFGLIIGIAGAFVGGWLLPQLGIHLGSGHYFRDRQCHHRRRDPIADHETGSGRKWMASKIGKGLE